jgi:hypothetical protein
MLLLGVGTLYEDGVGSLTLGLKHAVDLSVEIKRRHPNTANRLGLTDAPDTIFGLVRVPWCPRSIE